MKAWPVQDAKTHFSQLLHACLNDGPQMVTRRGTETAVLVPLAEWRRLHDAPACSSLKDLLLTDAARCDSLIPKRSSVVGRRSVKFD